MSHFAEIDNNNFVVRVLVGSNSESNEAYDWFIDNLGGKWIQTSYNGNIRKNYAGIGFTYDAGRDAFIPPKPYDSWLLDEETCQWKAPTPYPDDGLMYTWNEETTSWDLFEYETS
jgi:hypothetical protein